MDGKINMECERNELGRCPKDCTYLQLKQNNPDRYMCVTLAQGLYEYDTILIENTEWTKLMKTIPHKVKHQQEDGTWK